MRYFDAIGLETHLRKGTADWDETANAGLEDMPLGAKQDSLPYVIKTPWLYQVIDQLLAENVVKIDLVILPMRDLMDSATSRAIVEMQSIHQKTDKFSHFTKTWDSIGSAKGGMIYSLQPIDEARILATGFYYLVEKLVKNDIPVLFLSFPRFVNDSEYLYQQLKPYLKDSYTKKASDTAHKKIADSSKVRVGSDKNASESPDTQIPSPAEVENAALKREISRIRNSSSDLSKQHDSERARAEILETENTQLKKEISAIKNSRSWKVTKPLRKAKGGR